MVSWEFQNVIRQLKFGAPCLQTRYSAKQSVIVGDSDT